MILLNLKFTTNNYPTKTCTGKRPVASLTPELHTYRMTVAYKAIKISEKEQLVDFSIWLVDPRECS